MIGLSISGEASRGQIAQSAVEPKLVVVLAVVFNDDAGFAQSPKLLAVEALVSKPAMEALDEAILPGTARLEM